MEIQDRDEMFNMICQMSDQQVDENVKRRLQKLIGRPNTDIKDELLGLIDDIAFYAWTSNFEIQALHVIWLNIGGSEEELSKRKGNRYVS